MADRLDDAWEDIGRFSSEAQPFDGHLPTDYPSLPLDLHTISTGIGGFQFKRVLTGASRQPINNPHDAPWCRIGLLCLYRQGRRINHRTAFLVGRNVILTAKHELPSPSEGYQYSCDVRFGYNARDESHQPSFTCSGFQPARHVDLAVFLINASMTDWFSLPGEVDLVSTNPSPRVVLAGYGFAHLGRFGQSMGADVVQTHGDEISYYISTEEGDSGAPVFLQDDQDVVIGLHTTPGATSNSRNIGLPLLPHLRLIEQLIANLGGARA